MNAINRLLNKISMSKSIDDTLPELMRQDRICYPGYFDCEFSSLENAIRYFKRRRLDVESRLQYIIMYNICYRDYLREYGIEVLIRRILCDVPELSEEQNLFESLMAWYNREGKDLAKYDIQCYNIKDTFSVLGHEFNGLDDVIHHRSMCGRIGCGRIYLSECYSSNKLPGICISELYANYPIFDSYDIGDNRTYQNYLFTINQLRNEDMDKLSNMRRRTNYCLVHEYISEDLLPILYYQGDGNYMILASKKIKHYEK